MTTTIDMSASNANRPWQDSRSRAIGRTRAAGLTPARHWSLVGLALFLATVVVPESRVQGQARPRPRRVSRERATDAAALTAPQVASPDADYALSSTLSRTANPNDTNDTSIDINNILAQRLWQNRIMAPDPNEDAEIRQDLRSLIRQVRSVTFTDTATDPTYSAPIESTIEPRDTGAGAHATTEPAPLRSLATTPVSEPPAALPTDALRQLEELLRHPDRIEDPLEMAELLFLSGRTSEAALFYEKALTLLAADDPTTDDDRAWILFQLGNCLRETDMTKARDTYMKLISQYPGSPWTELAKVHGRFITWYQSAKPDQLMPKDE